MLLYVRKNISASTYGVRTVITGYDSMYLFFVLLCKKAPLSPVLDGIQFSAFISKLLARAVIPFQMTPDF